MYAIDDTIYCPALRGKAGEFGATHQLDAPVKDRILPLVVAASRHSKENHQLSPDAVMGQQIENIARHWGTRPCLLDLRCLKFDKDAGSDAARVSQLLRQAREAGCRVIPVVGIGTDFYRTAAVSAHATNTESGACIRVTFADLFNMQLGDIINTQLHDLRLSAQECLLALDLAAADLSPADAFANSVIGWLEQLRGYGPWRRMIVLASNYPTGRNPAPANGSKSVPRAEWAVWQLIRQIDRSVAAQTTFGDYGADHGHIDFGQGGRAIPHLRYATPDAWLIGRGGKDWKTIRNVARHIVGSEGYAGELFSAGDEFIASRAQNLETIGNPTEVPPVLTGQRQ